MGNLLASTKLLARAIAMQLHDNLVMPNLCYKDYSSAFKKQGDTIIVPKPAKFVAADFTVGTPVTRQDIVEDNVEVKLNHLATVDVQAEAVEMATNLSDLNTRVILPAAVALAEKINADGCGIYKEIPTVAGTIGTTPDGLDDLAKVREILNGAQAPVSGRVALWDAAADAKFVQIGNLIKVNEAGSPAGLREGEIGRVFGLDNYMSQGIKTATATITAATTVKLNGATTAGTSTTLAIDGASLTGKLSAGDVLKVGNTFYVVAEDSAAASTNAISGIKVLGAIGSHADNTDVTVYSGGVQNLAFHKNAIAFVTAPLMPASGTDSSTYTYNGITVRVVRDYDSAYKRELISADVLYGYKAVYPELALRYLG